MPLRTTWPTSTPGRRLAASLGVSNGIRVFDAGDGYRPLPSDTRYKDHSLSATFDRAGRLVTTSYDGLVRLYAAGNYATPVATFEFKGHLPFAAAFSPDGTRVAVGHDDINDVVVLSGSDLTRVFKADTAGVANVGMSAVGWSPDGRFLFAGGQWPVDDVSRVRRWSDSVDAEPLSISRRVPTRSWRSCAERRVDAVCARQGLRADRCGWQGN